MGVVQAQAKGHLERNAYILSIIVFDLGILVDLIYSGKNIT